MKRKKVSKKKARCPPQDRMHVSPRLLSGQTTQKPIGFGNELTPRAKTLDEESEDPWQD